MWLGEEDAGIRVTGETGAQQAFTRRKRSRTDAVGDIVRGGCELLAESGDIKRRDCEDADAALMTARVAGEVRAGALGSRGKCRIDDGDEFVHRSVSVSRGTDLQLHHRNSDFAAAWK
jgi:hypothetical protein